MDSELIRSLKNDDFSLKATKCYEETLQQINEDTYENDEQSTNDFPSMELLDSDTEADLAVPKMSSTLNNVENSIESPDVGIIKTPWNQSQISYREFEKRLYFIKSQSPSYRNNNDISLAKDLPNSRKSHFLTNLDAQDFGSTSLNSPRTILNRDKIISVSPNLRFIKERSENDSISRIKRENPRLKNSECAAGNVESDLSRGSDIRKYRTKRPPDLEISKDADGNNLRIPRTINRRITGAFAVPPDFGRSFPRVPLNYTVMQPLRENPSVGRILDEDQAKIALLLNTFGLAHLISIFLEQEVDVELFWTLNDQDLREIGITRQSDRNIVLSIIADCNRCQI